MSTKILKTTLLIMWIGTAYSSCSHYNTKIQKIEIRESAGVGPNGFLFILKVFDSDLYKVLDKCKGKAKLKFSPPLEELNTSSILCFTISEEEIHITVASTLWGDLSSEDIDEKELNLNKGKITIEVLDAEGNSWVISN